VVQYFHYLVDKLTSKKYAKTINVLCAGNKVFVKYQAQGGGFNPKTPSLRTPLQCIHAISNAVMRSQNTDG